MSFSGRHGEEGGRELSAEAGRTWSGCRGSCHPWRRRQGCRAIAAVTMSLSPQPIGEIYPAPQLGAALRSALGRVKWRASGRCVTGAWARAAARSNGRLRPSQRLSAFCFALARARWFRNSNPPTRGLGLREGHPKLVLFFFFIRGSTPIRSLSVLPFSSSPLNSHPTLASGADTGAGIDSSMRLIHPWLLRIK